MESEFEVLMEFEITDDPTCTDEQEPSQCKILKIKEDLLQTSHFQLRTKLIMKLLI